MTAFPRRFLSFAPGFAFLSVAALIFYSWDAYPWYHEKLSIGSLRVGSLAGIDKDGSFASISNATLGFEKIFIINLPERTDKRDALSLASSLTGVQLDFIPAVRGEAVSDKALPFGMERKFQQEHEGLMNNEIGTWRSHMNAMLTMVENNIASALIMEDDVDWDVRIKSQMQQFAVGTRSLLPPSAASQPHSPYGEDWDILWVGHCGEKFREDGDERRFTISNDPTVPDFDHILGELNFTDHAEHTRFVHPSWGPICLYGYAMSLAGARKMLYRHAVDELAAPVDNAMALACRGLDLGLKCISATPPYFYSHRSKGKTNKDSDIQFAGSNGEVRGKGTTENIVWPVRTNIERLLTGLEPEKQW